MSLTRIRSARFGDIEVPQETILKFPHGMPGFPEEKQFAVLPYGPDSPFVFLQSVTEPQLTFLLVEAFPVFRDYSFEIDDRLGAEMGLSADNTPQIFNIVTVPANPADMTANLLAPVIVNWRDRLAVQYVLEKSPYTTRHRIFPEGTQWPKGGE
ncbi:flagellar assembly protein FliW [Acetonema longum]|uniref:Flagellar assembly factor FliW n=1 Tax=Acetonema longum DSM 6540 TaxID=1009370 RepID=F7NNU7_9FIRM|nr:flagellar assembly protein FliW [Acetonema longum]EGO62281.1 flagellar assembly factor fliW [Acetonema longum DSM 6540]